MMKEAKEEESTLSVHGHGVKVTEVLKDGDGLTFLIVSQKLSGTGEYHVDRTYEDFEWLQQQLFTQEDVPGIQGVIFPPLPAKAQVNASAKAVKQLGFLALEELQPYCAALETFIHQPPGRQRARKNIFNRLSQAVEEMRKESHKDVDDFFQSQRDMNIALTGSTKNAVEKFLDVVLSEQKIAVACGHFAASLHLCVESGDDPDKAAFSKICVKLSDIFESMKKNMTNVAKNDVSTLGLGLDLESRYQEAEKEMLFRRTCKLVELETARKNAEKAKPVKKAALEEVKKAAETEFDHICEVAKQEIEHFQGERVQMLQQALVSWCEKQLLTARETAEQYNQHLQAFREM
ncbi:sorting nexin-6 isoform X2 [Dunckerocampus dactyliophorus]|uniref:sorting nexin-6 isoform X2 n=1 Tax=Dunckerocampus dactyliophorus TaxID=161453 RepID=UPI002406FCF6|nr:sorting nexin-6 isoform X2 [Dunckerocampus dactyliophorus]